mmetsp:Transcript_10522/g.18070  ORF Transcript_10522/g.18070 Transcript_10522/m.18070 type:complete len:206 (+) Transcript_10522:644-1261(+)
MLQALMSEEARLRRYVEKGDVEKVKECIANGARVDHKDSHGNPLIITAIQHKQIQVVETLLDASLCVEERGEWSTTPLIMAAKVGCKEVCALLLKRGADIDSVDVSGQCALTHAILNHNNEVMRFLLESGALMDLKDSRFKDPIHYASSSDTVEAADIMLDYCVKNNGWDRYIVRLEFASCRYNIEIAYTVNTNFSLNKTKSVTA